MEESFDNYKRIIEKIKKRNPDCKLYVESILPTATIDLDVIEYYNSVLYDICNAEGVYYIDLYNEYLIEDKVNADLFSTDGIHLNGKGYKVWIEMINKFVNS